MSRKTSPADVRLKRLLRAAPDRLSVEDREFLLRRIASATPEEILELGSSHPWLLATTELSKRLISLIPELSWANARWFAPCLAQHLDPNVYADVVKGAQASLRASGNDDAKDVEWLFLEPLRGDHDGYYTSIVAADRREVGREPLALRFIDIRFDRKQCDGALRALAESTPLEAVRVWDVARSIGDSDLERFARSEVLRHFDVERDSEYPDAPAWHKPVFQAVWSWLSQAPPEVWTADMMTCAEAAHARGAPWESLAWKFHLDGRGSAIQARLHERSLDEDERPSFFALGILAEPLAAGDEAAWRRLFQWVERSKSSELSVRDLLRSACRPAQPDEAFWQSFLLAWECGRAAERASNERIDADIHRRGEGRADEWWLRARLTKQSGIEPPTSPGELVEILLAHPPTVTTARELARLLVDAPKHLADPRVVAFGALTRELSWETVPRVDLESPVAVAGFLAVYHETAVRSLRAEMRARASKYGFSEKWLAQPWFDAIVDAPLRDFLRQQTFARPFVELVPVADRFPTWIDRAEVAACLASAELEKASLRDFPQWLDEALLERAKTSPEEELEAMLPRFHHHTTLGEAFREMLRARLAAGTVHQAFVHFASAPTHEGLPGDEEDVGPWNPSAVERFLAGHGDAPAREVLAVLEQYRSNLAFLQRDGWLRQVSWKLALRAELRAGLPDQLLARPVHELVRLAEVHPTWVSRDEVVARTSCGPNGLGADRLSDLPEWLDEPLLARARTCTLDELGSLTLRFHRHERHGKVFDDLLRSRIPDGTVALLGRVLDNRSAWEKSGPSIVYDLLRLGRPREVWELVTVSAKALAPPDGDKLPGNVVVAMHLAVAQGVLRWAEERIPTAEHDEVERALIAIAHLDPPPPFTRDLRTFGKIAGLDAGAAEWLKQIHAIAKDHGGKEATLLGLRDCVAELCAKEAA